MQNDKPPEESPHPLERRLATILVADIFGYSRMMHVNEERTVEIFRGHREIFDELLRQHHGRIFNTAGDAVLAEFPSAVEAVRCATEIQTALRTRNEHLPEEQRMWFRIGINLGDVIVQGGDLLGDGVNVAARIQTVAEPGGVCISGSVYDQIQNKLTLQFVSMGERSFKNIVQPIRTFSIAEADGEAMPAASKPKRPKGRKIGGIIAAVAALIVVAVGGYLIFSHYETRHVGELRQAVELERRAAEEKRQAAEAQARANEEQLAAKAKQMQAKLEAEAYQRQAAEAQQRKAKLEAEAAAAKAALDKTEADRARFDQELKRAASEKREAELRATEKTAAAAPPAKDVRAPDRFDGTYTGRMCHKPPGQQKEVCWPVPLKIEYGKVRGTWLDRKKKSCHLEGKISADGTLFFTLQAWRADGESFTGNMTGKVDDKIINASGYWENMLPVKGNWAEEPKHAMNTTAAAPPAKDVRAPDRFAGTYKGSMCSKPPGFLQKEKCWPVPLKIEYGEVLGTWLDRKTGKYAHVKGTISADGSLSLTLQGWRADGKSVSANMSGKVDDKIIKASGYWESGYTVNGSWERNF